MKKFIKNINLKAVIDFYTDGNQKKFAETTGMGTVNVHNALYRNNTISAENIDKIISVYPKINIQYLMQKSSIMHLEPSASTDKREPIAKIVISEASVNDAQRRFIETLDKWRFRNNNATLTTVANKLQVQTSGLSEYRSGTRNISLEIIVKAANVFNINPNYIILGMAPEFLTGSVQQNDSILKEKLKSCEEKCQLLTKNLEDMRDIAKKNVSKKVSTTDKVKKPVKRK